jgi:hypothetical protein
VLGYTSREPRRSSLLQPSGAYAPTRWHRAVPAPDGRLVAVCDVDGDVGIVPAGRVDDPAAVRWVRAVRNVGAPEAWSSDSRWLWVAGRIESGPARGPERRISTTGRIVEAATLAVRTVRLTVDQLPPATSRLVFAPGGYAVASAYAPAAPGLLRFVDDRGAETRRLPVAGLTGLADRPFSPDGRRVLVSTRDGARVLDVDSGATLARVAGTAAGWYDDASVLVLAGAQLRRIALPDGRVLDTWTPDPARSELAGVWLGRVDRPAPGMLML